MKYTLSILCFLCVSYASISQNIALKRYSESNINGILIQNSFPKGGNYTAPVDKHFNYSYLVFVHSVSNQSDQSFELSMDLSDNTVTIPGSHDTFMRLFMPDEAMTSEKLNEFSYGIPVDFDPFEQSATIQRTLKPNEELMFYVVAVFYQTKADLKHQLRGGNRAELFLDGNNLYYRILPQLEAFPIGEINITK